MCCLRLVKRIFIFHTKFTPRGNRFIGLRKVKESSGTEFEGFNRNKVSLFLPLLSFSYRAKSFKICLKEKTRKMFTFVQTKTLFLFRELSHITELANEQRDKVSERFMAINQISLFCCQLCGELNLACK